jgi:hypothetical protein
MKVTARAKLLDTLGRLLTPAAAKLAAVQARYGPRLLPASYKAWDEQGVLPVPYHYHQPVIHPAELPPSTWTTADPLYGIKMRPEAQLELLRQLRYGDELRQIPLEGHRTAFPPRFFYLNEAFGPGDAEILYSMIRHFRPHKMIEVGCGWSSLMAELAFTKNRSEGFPGQHICIEPFENGWLESIGFDQVIRKRVEEVELTLFEQLAENDILFIDSSHVLRTRGDVMYEILHILPRLNKNVLVHFHDIFLPFEYPQEWIQIDRRFWTEQYFLQAFLAFNSAFEVVAALNYLHACHRSELTQACPVLEKTAATPGSFWIRRVSG